MIGGRKQEALRRVIGNEEECRAGRRAYECRSNALVESTEATSSVEASAGLKTRLKGIYRVQ